MIQDAAYEALLKSTRRDLHRRVAQTMTERFPALAEAQPQVLARHWSDAGEAEPAVAAWTKAARAADARHAYSRPAPTRSLRPSAWRAAPCPRVPRGGAWSGGRIGRPRHGLHDPQRSLISRETRAFRHPDASRMSGGGVGVHGQDAARRSDAAHYGTLPLVPASTAHAGKRSPGSGRSDVGTVQPWDHMDPALPKYPRRPG